MKDDAASAAAAARAAAPSASPPSGPGAPPPPPRRVRRDVVVVGASAGGVRALIGLVCALPAGFAAAVLVVLHVPAGLPSRLAEILGDAGPLPASPAEDGEALVSGRIYVAPPDRHLTVGDGGGGGGIRLGHGPRENHARPAIDPLFRSAAACFGPRVAGVILSGALYDGSRGLAAVKAAGGAALVQDPEEALVGGMPRAALAATEVDGVLPVKGLAARLAQLAETDAAGLLAS